MTNYTKKSKVRKEFHEQSWDEKMKEWQEVTAKELAWDALPKLDKEKFLKLAKQANDQRLIEHMK